MRESDKHPFNIHYYHRYNRIVSKVQKKRIKRSQGENIAKPGRENKHRDRRKRQAAETVVYDLGKKNHIVK